MQLGEKREVKGGKWGRIKGIRIKEKLLYSGNREECYCSNAKQNRASERKDHIRRQNKVGNLDRIEIGFVLVYK